MTRRRFGILLALLVLVMTVGAFIVTTALLDGGPTTPEGAVPPGAETTTSSSTPATTPPAGGTIGETPAYVVVVTSAIDEATAQASRDTLTEQGFSAGVLDSDDYSSLNPGYYVTYVGPYPDSAAATAAHDDLVSSGGYSIGEIYVRCVGTDEECG